MPSLMSDDSTSVIPPPKRPEFDTEASQPLRSRSRPSTVAMISVGSCEAKAAKAP